MSTLHGTVVEIGGVGVLLRGEPGSGKSSLALRLIDAEGFGLGEKPLRAQLVADDQFLLEKTEAGLVARAPAPLSGLLEIRGIGIVRLAHKAETLMSLVVDLAPGAALARMPELHDIQTELLGVQIRRLALDAADPAAAAKIRASLF
jgi:serine kinase of HPr protein (carbohydrate metabolism regulator)